MMIKKPLLAIFLFSIYVASAAAQTKPAQAVINAQEQVSDIKKRSIELERMKREAGKRSVSDNLTRRFPEIKEDFEEIQKINANVLKLTSGKTTIDYPAVLKAVSEIKRRAVRLKSNLFSSEPEEINETKNKPQNIAETRDVTKLFEALDKSIDSFVHSSIFKNINIVNSDDSLKAQKDLEDVIRFSSVLRAKTKKLAGNDSRK